MLDMVDRKILFQLDLNCRQSTNEIAKKVMVHRNVVLYRIRRLEETGIIRGYFSEINTRALGFLSFRAFIKFANSTMQKEEQLVTFLQNTSEIIWLFRVSGKWDVDFVFVCKTPEEFDDFFRRLRAMYNDIIEFHETSLMTQLFKYPKNYLIEDKTRYPAEETFSSAIVQIDDADRKILRIMANNANIKIMDLAQQVGLTINTVKDRMKQLQKKGVIVGFRPFIDTNKTGYKYYRVHINMKHYSQEDYLRMKEFIGLQPEVIYIVQYIQGADIEVELHCKNEEDLLRLMNDTKNEFGDHIQEIYSLKFYNEYVYKYLPENI